MKESINYYYNFNISDVEDYDGYYTFKKDGNTYFLVPYKRSEKELNDIIEVSRELKNKGIKCHDIILNRLGKVITNIYNENYVLLRPVGDFLEEYDISDIIKMNRRLILNKDKEKLYKNSWGKLWSDKVDFFEYQVRELGANKKIVLDSFSYYIGLAENGIAYANNIDLVYNRTELDRLSLSRRRIRYPNISLNYLNPISFIIDLEVRDIASFIKSSFFKGEDSLNILKEVLKINKFSIYSYGMLYARLLYPSYYFDIYDGIMNKDLNEESLIPIIEKAKDYESFLKNAFLEINKYASIPRIEWILK